MSPNPVAWGGQGKVLGGVGIPADVLPRVFERFYRGESSHDNTIDGCGLGLSIPQWIVAAHRGEIRIDSPTGQPTMVTVRLPLP